MPSFLTERFTLTGTITKLVDSADFDRTVIISAKVGGSLFVAFDGSGDEASGQGPTEFTLPQGSELWARDGSGSGSVDLIITR